jgi:hypothetical protein
MNILSVKKYMNYLKKKIPLFSKIFAVSTIFILIFIEINGQYNQIISTVSKFNINFFLAALVFFILSQLIFAYIIFLIYNLSIKIKLHNNYKIIFTGQFLDYFPFLGFLYKAKTLKDNFKLSYKKYLSIYVLLLTIGLLSLTSILSILSFLPIKNILNLNQYIKYYIICLFILILIFNFLGNFFLKIVKKKKYYFYIFKKKINIFELFLVFFQLLSETFINKLRYLKFILLQISGLVILSISFFFLFKIYQIETSLLNIIFIFMVLLFSTQIKILPKNYGLEELAGSYLIEAMTGSFATGIILMITYRLLAIIGSMLLFIVFNIKINFIK